MAASSTISSKGQITVPVEIRQRLGLKPGDRVEFVVENDRTVLLPPQREENPFEKYIGALPYDKPAPDSVAFWREMRGHDPSDEDDF
jgi:antitoxin PrlF